MSEHEFLEQMKLEGGFAFPSETKIASGGTLTCRGMSLRDWFAAQALSGFAANKFVIWTNEGIGKEISRVSYAVADEMLKARQP